MASPIFHSGVAVGRTTAVNLRGATLVSTRDSGATATGRGVADGDVMQPLAAAAIIAATNTGFRRATTTAACILRGPSFWIALHRCSISGSGYGRAEAAEGGERDAQFGAVKHPDAA